MEFLQENNWLVLLAGMVMVTMWLMSRLAKRRRHDAANPPLSSRDHLERARQIRGLRGDMDDLMVEVEQLSKRLSAQLDAKTVQLERMLDRADATITQLQKLTPGALDRDPMSPPPPPPAASAPPDDPLAQSVYELADQGHDPPAIASRIGEHVGKVELILALRNP